MSTSAPQRLGWMATLVVALIGGAAFFVGFALLPGAAAGASSGGAPTSLWLRICRAAGYVAPMAATVASPASAQLTSVVLPRSALRQGTPDEVGRGATLALRCTACHGAQGMSGANAPNLAGQYAEVIYKQLVDFQRGPRSDAVMGAMVATLTDDNMLDVAHYYASVQRSPGYRAPLPPALVRVGDPMRNIAPCASCHGSRDGKLGAPALEGEPKEYLHKQLLAFKTGARQNDANGSMRNEVHHLSTAEIDTLTDYYAHESL